MATILKQAKASGIRYKAVIKLKNRIVKTKTFKTKTAANTWAKQVEGNLDHLNALGLPDASITVKELAKEYLKNAWRGKDHSRPGRVMWWVEQIGHIKLADLTPKLIRKHLNDYLDGEGKRACGKVKGKTQYKSTGKKRSNSSHNQMRVALSSMLKYAMEKDYINNNPAKAVQTKTENNKRCRFLSDEERRSLLAAARRSNYARMHLLILLALTTGARKSELLGLKWFDINFDECTANLYDTKNGSDRKLTLPSPALNELTKVREVGDGHVFPSAQDPHKPMNLNKYWYDVLEDAGIQDFRFHDLRHTCASALVQNGATLYETGQVLGHKSVTTTARYAHLSVEHRVKLTERVFTDLLEGEV